MAAFHFNDRFYQRGQTWWECLESWEHQRADFLRLVKNDRRLDATAARLREIDGQARLAVVYSQHLRDSRMALPAIGNTFARAEGLLVRYFWADVFFPEFYCFLERPSFRLLQLDEAGAVVASWGPRPTAITRELEGLQLSSSGARDKWLCRYDEERFLQSLDASLTNDFL